MERPNGSTSRAAQRAQGLGVQVSSHVTSSSGGQADSCSVAFSPDGKTLVSGSLDRTLRVWDLTNTKKAVESAPPGAKDIDKGLGVCQSTLNGHKVGLDLAARVFLLLWTSSLPSPHSCRLGFADPQQDYVLSVAVSPDGQWVVSGSKDRSIQFWSVATGQAQFMLQGHKNSVISIDLAKTGNHLASGSGDCMARIWKYEPLEGAR